MDVNSKVIALSDKTGEGDFPLEKKIGIARGSLFNWRNNKSKPTSDALLKIADYFDVSVDYLLGREKKEPSEITEDSVMLELKKLGLYDKLNGMNAEDRKIALDTFSSLCENLSKNRK